MRKKDCRLSFEGSMESLKGPLTVSAEIFELTPLLRVVEVRKKGGTTESAKSFVTVN